MRGEGSNQAAPEVLHEGSLETSIENDHRAHEEEDLDRDTGIRSSLGEPSSTTQDDSSLSGRPPRYLYDGVRLPLNHPTNLHRFELLVSVIDLMNDPRFNYIDNRDFARRYLRRRVDIITYELRNLHPRERAEDLVVAILLHLLRFVIEPVELPEDMGYP